MSKCAFIFFHLELESLNFLSFGSRFKMPFVSHANVSLYNEPGSICFKLICGLEPLTKFQEIQKVQGSCLVVLVIACSLYCCMCHSPTVVFLK